ncbi:hypothetical protein BD560DRAFT_489963 [Blakeslea trispora]|nr:hypothetical protein BD560DRAFT_489963 [Blakeslea trispora]
MSNQKKLDYLSRNIRDFNSVNGARHVQRCRDCLILSMHNKLFDILQLMKNTQLSECFVLTKERMDKACATIMFVSTNNTIHLVQNKAQFRVISRETTGENAIRQLAHPFTDSFYQNLKIWISYGDCFSPSDFLGANINRTLPVSSDNISPDQLMMLWFSEKPKRIDSGPTGSGSMHNLLAKMISC